MRKIILAAAALSLFAATEASAHARLLRAAPKAGATVAAPKVLRLSYSETIVPAASAVALTRADKTPVATGAIALDAKDKRVVLVPVTAALSPGAYHVSWRMKTADGHTTDGDFDFKVK
jgi:methionine-rich copper-binding protein CopC